MEFKKEEKILLNKLIRRNIDIEDALNSALTYVKVRPRFHKQEYEFFLDIVFTETWAFLVTDSNLNNEEPSNIFNGENYDILLNLIKKLYAKKIKKEYLKMKERDSLNESTYFKRRVPSDIFEEYLNMTIDDFAKRYIKYKKKWNHLDDEKILIQIVSELMGELDFRLSNGGVDMYPFDEIYEFIIIKYKDKILETFYKVVKQYENTIKNNINENYNRLVDLVDMFMLENYPLFRKNKGFIKNNKVFDGFTYKPSEESDEWFAKYWLDDNELELNKKIYKTFEAYFGEKYLGAFLSWFNREFDVEAENIDF